MLCVVVISIFCSVQCYGLEVNEEANVYKFKPDVLKNVSELIADKGYPVEEHSVTTTDGYIISFQRIPHGIKGKESRRDVVLVIHGMGGSSADWVLDYPGQSLGFIAADEGYDVWLGNTRGNKYTRNHVKYSPYQTEFWDFSFDEMALYDVPAMIDYILDVTGEDSLNCIGYSQGGTVVLALLSDKPEYNRKIKLYIAVAPTIGYIESPLTFLAPFATMAYKIVGSQEFFISNVWNNPVLMEMFATHSNKSRSDVYAAHNPAGTSTKSYFHFGQIMTSKQFRKFDYVGDNVLYYNQEMPPVYNISFITTPVALIYAPKDILTIADIKILEKRLKSLVTTYIIPSPTFKHFDFAIGMDAKKLVYDHMLKLFTQY